MGHQEAASLTVQRFSQRSLDIIPTASRSRIHRNAKPVFAQRDQESLGPASLGEQASAPDPDPVFSEAGL